MPVVQEFGFQLLGHTIKFLKEASLIRGFFVPVRFVFLLT